MNNLRNNVRLIGNLGTDPELRELKGGKKLAKFSLATNEIYTNEKGEKVKETQWHHIVTWGKLAESAVRHLKKGSEIAVEGRLNTSSYTDKEGVKKYFTEIVANEWMMLGQKSD